MYVYCIHYLLHMYLECMVKVAVYYLLNVDFQYLTATHATDISDLITTVTQRVTVAQSKQNFELAIISAIAENILLQVFST